MTFLVTALVFYLVWTFVQCYNQRDRLFLLQKTTEDETESVLVATWKDGDIPTGCEILTNKEIIDNVLSTSDPSKISSLSEDDMKILLDDCSYFKSKEEKLQRMVETSTRMPMRDVIRNSYQNLRSRNDEDRTSQTQRQGPQNSGIIDDTRVNYMKTTTSIDYLKPFWRENARSTDVRRYSTESPRNAVGRYPEWEMVRTITMDRYTTESTRSGIERDLSRDNSRRRTSGRYPEESTRIGIERNPAEENARRTAINRYSTEPTRSGLKRNSTRGNWRTTIGRYPSESTTKRTSTGRTRVFNAKTTDVNNLDTTTMATSSSTVPGYNGIPIIMPGTKWCGAGDVARHEEDLGMSEETDKCCRAHDHCNDTLAPGETRGNLTNDSSFTLLNCQCDEEFYDCLDSSNSFASNTVGNLYFNILARKCYKKDYPLKCKRYLTIFQVTCREYESDKSQKRSYNWYPAKRYRKIFKK